MSNIVALILLFVSTLCLGQVGVLPKTDVSLKQVDDAKFRVGDVWEYVTRQGEEGSRLTIVRMDNSPELGVIVHVAVDNIKLRNCHGGPEPDSVPHMPFARKALDSSIVKRIGSHQPLPSFQNGYDEWRSAYEHKKAGIYIISVAQAITVAEKTFQHGIGCDSDTQTSSSQR